MTPLLIALVVTFGVIILPSGRPYRRAAAITAVVSVIVLLKVFTSSDELDRYRVSLLGLRYAMADSAGAPTGDTVFFGGPRDQIDFFVAGSNRKRLGAVTTTGTDSVEAITALPVEDGSGVLMVIPPGEDRWRIVGGITLSESDTIVVHSPGGPYRLTLHNAGRYFAVRWHGVEVDTVGGTVPVDIPRLKGFQPLPRGRTPFRRSYPISDFLEIALGSGEGWGHVNSFLYYDRNTLFIADVDSEVEVVGPSGVRGPDPVSIWTSETGSALLRAAALPYKDYPEQDLTPPERYGVRSLRTMSPRSSGRWMDFYLTTPEAYTLTADQLEELTEPGSRYGRDAYHIRISPASVTLLRRVLAFRLPSGQFGVTSPAVLELPRSPLDREIGVLTPAGYATETRGEAFPIGEASTSSLIMRVDRDATSLLFWPLLILPFGLAMVVFLLGDSMAPNGTGHTVVSTAVASIALAIVGMLALRLLLAFSAFANPPFSDESYELSLWLIPVVPFVIVLSGWLGFYARRDTAEMPQGAAKWLVLTAFTLAALSFAIFEMSARAIILAMVPLGLTVVFLLTTTAALPQGLRGLAETVAGAAGTGLGHVADGARALAGSKPAMVGLRLGGALFGMRFVLWVFGWREVVSLGGQRVALSLIYTPLALVALAWILYIHLAEVREARSGPEFRKRFAYFILDLGVYLILAFALVSWRIGDFGVTLTGLPGPLVLLCLLALFPAVHRGEANRIVVGLVIPLALFVTIQADPSLIPNYPSTGVQEDLRVQYWERDELLLLERGDPESLRFIGQRRSEALAVMRETMRAYTRGNWMGSGMYGGQISPEILATSTREHTTSALLASEWGLPGSTALLLLLVVSTVGVHRTLNVKGTEPTAFGPAFGLLIGMPLLATVVPPPADRLIVGLLLIAVAAWLFRPLGWPGKGGARLPAETWTEIGPAWLLGALAMLTFALAGVYMLLANYGWVLFTGKNVYLFGLDSVSDALESMVLLATASTALAISGGDQPE